MCKVVGWGVTCEWRVMPWKFVENIEGGRGECVSLFLSEREVPRMHKSVLRCQAEAAGHMR